MTSTPPLPRRPAHAFAVLLTPVAAVCGLLAILGTLGAPLTAQTGPGNGRIEVLNARGEVTPLQPVLIVSETLDEVRFKRGSNDRTESRNGDQVVGIVYGSGSATYENGLDALESGDLVQAVNLFTAAAEESDPPWQAPVALLKLGEAQARRGAQHMADARAALDRFLQAHPEHRRLPEALIQRGRYALATGEGAALDTAVERVRALVDQRRTPGTWLVRAQVEQGHARLADDQPAEARAAYDAALATAQRVRPDLQGRADLLAQLDRLALDARGGTGSALLAAGDLAGARSFFSALQADAAGDAAVQVAALNGLAQTDFEEGGGDKLKQAQVGFAKAAVLGAAIDDQHAKSLYYLGRCALALAEAERLDPSAAQAEARQYGRLVQNRYPDSRWARLARESLP